MAPASNKANPREAALDAVYDRRQPDFDQIVESLTTWGSRPHRERLKIPTDMVARMIADMLLVLFKHNLILPRISSTRYKTASLMSKINSQLMTNGKAIGIPLSFLVPAKDDGHRTDTNMIRTKHFQVDSSSILLDFSDMLTVFGSRDLDARHARNECLSEFFWQLTNKLDHAGIDTLLYGGGNVVGTPGISLVHGNINDFIEARALLQEEEAPGFHLRMAGNYGPHDWIAILNPETDRRLVEYMVKNGMHYSNPILGFERVVYNYLNSYKTGTRTAVKKGNVCVVGAPPVPGLQATSNRKKITLGGLVAGGTFLKGEYFTITGVRRIHPRQRTVRHGSNSDYTFWIAENAKVSTDGKAILTLTEEINDKDLIDENGQVRACQNINEYPADDAIVTLGGEADSSYERAVITHPYAIEYCPIKVPKQSHDDCVAEDTFQSITVQVCYNKDEYKDDYKYSIAWGIGMIDPFYVVHMIGQRLGSA